MVRNNLREDALMHQFEDVVAQTRVGEQSREEATPMVRAQVAGSVSTLGCACAKFAR